jgi:hypothetical protein
MRFMTTPRNSRDWLWTIAGAIGLLVAALVMWHSHTEGSTSAQLALRNRRVGLVQQIQVDLSRASEAEKSAVMAITDEESKSFADQSREASSAVEKERDDLERLLQSGGDRSEQKSLSEFSQAFAEYRRVDNELLDLAVKNTNLKAYSLAFGPAAESIHEMDQAISRLITASAKSVSPNAKQVMLLAGEAESGALRIQALLPAHISEESNQRMDAMESAMAAEDRQVRTSLDGLAALVAPTESGDLRAAVASYARFSELRTQILELSRENTNVRSLTISLNRKRLIDVKCQDALSALEEAIQKEPLPETPASPR